MEADPKRCDLYGERVTADINVGMFIADAVCVADQ